MDTSTATAFHLRLQWLEAILSNPESTVRQSLLFPQHPSLLNTTPGGQAGREEDESSHDKDVTNRTGDLFQQLREAVLDSGHDSLRRLVDEYDSFATVLFPIVPSPEPNQQSGSPTGTSSNPRRTTPSDTLALSPADLIPAATKLELVLGATDDLKDAERMLREIEVLLEREVDGSGDLACGCMTEFIR
ncbi:hypothetical protein QFC19_008679 [Naganishia cerealis]|uniref:Uncharacterized protein n=1 Tax=Naganishia cerealis TaxID=610337 RepID=A0ACC2V1A1_9TREE|nr:hypothetical protein QFC19_008679 [Naganishia cerealis]